MIENAKIAGYDLVFEDCAWRDVDAVSVIGDDDDGTLETQKSIKTN